MTVTHEHWLTDAPPGPRFKSWPRAKPPDAIVIHESVTSSRAKTVAVLAARGLGVHIIIDRDGSVTEHVPLNHATAHAGSLYNSRSVAIEVVNRYYGSQGDDGDPDIKTAWAHREWYILPTPAQLEAVWHTIKGIVDACPTIPLKFPAAPDDSSEFTWGRFPLLKRPILGRAPGVVAHHRTDHADGLFIEHYCVLRHRGFLSGAAYTRTVIAAQEPSRTYPLPPFSAGH